MLFYQGSMYFIHNGKYRLVPDFETAKFLCPTTIQSLGDIKNATSETIEELTLGVPLPSMQMQVINVDEVYRVYGLMWDAYQDNPNFVINLKWIGFFYNPTVTQFRDKLLMLDISDSKVCFWWLDKDFIPMNITYLGIGPNLTCTFGKDLKLIEGGPDPRVLGTIYYFPCISANFTFSWYFSVSLRDKSAK